MNHLKVLILVSLIIFNTFFISASIDVGFNDNTLPQVIIQQPITSSSSSGNITDADTLDGHDSTYFYPASNPNSFIDDGNTLWDNIYGFITSWFVADTSNGYLFNDSTKIYFNDTQLNNTINNKIAGIGGDNSSWNESYADGLYFKRNANIDDTGYNITAQNINATATIWTNSLSASDGVSSSNGLAVMNSVGSNGLLYLKNSSGDLTFYFDGGFFDRSYMLSSLGIKTSSPTHTLNVVGSANITGDIFMNGNVNLSSMFTNYTQLTFNLYNSTWDNRALLPQYNDTTWVNAQGFVKNDTIARLTKLGIGTGMENPTYALNINGSQAIEQGFGLALRSAGAPALVPRPAGIVIGASTSNADTRFEYATNTLFDIDSRRGGAGQTLQIRNSAGGGLQINMPSGGLAVAGDLVVNTDDLYVLTTTHRVGIETKTPTHTLNVVGNANITGINYLGNNLILNDAMGIGTTQITHNLTVLGNAYFGTQGLGSAGIVLKQGALGTKVITIEGSAIEEALEISSDQGGLILEPEQYTGVSIWTREETEDYPLLVNGTGNFTNNLFIGNNLTSGTLILGTPTYTGIYDAGYLNVANDGRFGGTLLVGENSATADATMLFSQSSASLKWDDSDDTFRFNKAINVTGNVSASDFYRNGANLITLLNETSWVLAQNYLQNNTNVALTSLTLTGELTANSNTPSSCGWEAGTLSGDTSNCGGICGNGKFMAGTNITVGLASISSCEIYCCEL